MCDDVGLVQSNYTHWQAMIPREEYAHEDQEEMGLFTF